MIASVILRITCTCNTFAGNSLVFQKKLLQQIIPLQEIIFYILTSKDPFYFTVVNAVLGTVKVISIVSPPRVTFIVTILPTLALSM